MPENPKCRNHPDRPAKLRTDGISTGLCQECLDARNERARQARAASGSKPGGPKQAAAGQGLSPAQAIKQLAMMAPVLKGRTEALRGALAVDDPAALVADAQGVLAVLDIMGETGVLPGWADK